MGGSRFAADWYHCSPKLLNAGVACGPTPRRLCQCEDEHGLRKGSHDHLVDRSWATEALGGEQPAAGAEG